MLKKLLSPAAHTLEVTQERAPPPDSNGPPYNHPSKFENLVFEKEWVSRACEYVGDGRRINTHMQQFWKALAEIEEEHARKLRALVSSSHGQLKEVSPLARTFFGEGRNEEGSFKRAWQTMCNGLLQEADLYSTRSRDIHRMATSQSEFSARWEQQFKGVSKQVRHAKAELSSVLSTMSKLETEFGKKQERYRTLQSQLSAAEVKAKTKNEMGGEEASKKVDQGRHRSLRAVVGEKTKAKTENQEREAESEYVDVKAKLEEGISETRSAIRRTFGGLFPRCLNELQALEEERVQAAQHFLMKYSGESAEHFSRLDKAGHRDLSHACALINDKEDIQLFLTSEMTNKTPLLPPAVPRLIPQENSFSRLAYFNDEELQEIWRNTWISEEEDESSISLYSSCYNTPVARELAETRSLEQLEEFEVEQDGKTTARFRFHPDSFKVYDHVCASTSALPPDQTHQRNDEDPPLLMPEALPTDDETEMASVPSAATKPKKKKLKSKRSRALRGISFPKRKDSKVAEIGAPTCAEHVSHVTQSLRWKGADAEFDVLEELGRGSFGVVYRGIHEPSGTKIAIKMIDLPRCSDPDPNVQKAFEETIACQKAQMEREIEILTRFSAPNVVQYYGCVWPTEHSVWLLLEYCKQGSLSDVLEDTGIKLTETQIAGVLYTVLMAVAYLHAHKICHFDIKGNNLLLTEQGEIRVTDFGLAKKFVEIDANTAVQGTRHWMAPELFQYPREHEPGPRCDVWSIGITAIELAEGHPPHSDHSGVEVGRLIRDGPAPRLSPVAEWSADFHHFVRFALVKDPLARPSVVELLAHPFIILGKASCARSKKPVLRNLVKKSSKIQDKRI